MVKKKRRAWWIVGGVATAIALFVAIAFYLDYNSTDAMAERAVAQIVEEYGFEYYDGSLTEVMWFDDDYEVMYSRAPMDSDTADEIVEKLRAACPWWKYSYDACDKDFRPVVKNGGEPWREIHGFYLQSEISGYWNTRIQFTPYNKFVFENEEPIAVIDVIWYPRPSLWQRIKGLWPW